uniref:Uncharacterized protein n=1 Tax=Vitrella brassicaformis TaxID=1169539 RepID=A0A7S1P4Z9_9ALVE|mmetsp:Transcript_32176/g.79726  ORF Transcript_32176/g.79726 Transcript_32176/m.79726 type:complete len:322 (+) Transcript_32176:65-1030(+)
MYGVRTFLRPCTLHPITNQTDRLKRTLAPKSDTKNRKTNSNEVEDAPLAHTGLATPTVTHMLSLVEDKKRTDAYANAGEISFRRAAVVVVRERYVIHSAVVVAASSLNAVDFDCDAILSVKCFRVNHDDVFKAGTPRGPAAFTIGCVCSAGRPQQTQDASLTTPYSPRIFVAHDEIRIPSQGVNAHDDVAIPPVVPPDGANHTFSLINREGKIRKGCRAERDGRLLRLRQVSVRPILSVDFIVTAALIGPNNEPPVAREDHRIIVSLYCATSCFSLPDNSDRKVSPLDAFVACFFAGLSMAWAVSSCSLPVPVTSITLLTS